MKDYMNKEYIRIMVIQLKNCTKNNKVYITKHQDEKDIILITLKELKEKRKVDVTAAVLDYLNGNCNLKELEEYIWNRYQAWEHKNIQPNTEKKLRPGLRKMVAKEYPNYEQMLKNIGISWTGFKTRVQRGMSYYEALTTPKVQPGWGRVKKES